MTWLLYFSVPCLSGLLPERFLSHFRLLSEAIYCLLINDLTSQHINDCRKNISTFLDRFEGLYSTSMCTYNVHSLGHIVDSVERMGPLFAHSAFSFEDGNRRLLSTVSAANGVPLQIMDRYSQFYQLREEAPEFVQLRQEVASICKGTIFEHLF